VDLLELVGAFSDPVGNATNRTSKA